MKNVFVKTVLALFLIPGFLLTSVVSAQAEYRIYVKEGTSLGPQVGSLGNHPDDATPVSYGAYFGGACESWNLARDNDGVPLGEARASDNPPKYYQWVAEKEVCYYYEDGSDSGPTGKYTYQWDE